MGTVSKSNSSVLNSLCANAIMKTTMQCVTNATQQQLIQIGNVGGTVDLSNINLEEGSVINLSCLMTTAKTADMAQNVASTLAQAANSQGESLLSALGKTQAEVESNLANQITTNIDTSTLTQVTNALNQTQGFNVQNVGGNVIMKNVTISQQANLASNAIVNSSAFATVIGSVANTLTQSATAKETNPLSNIIGATLSGISGLWSTALKGLGSIISGPGFIIIFIAAISILGLFLYLRSGGSLSAFSMKSGEASGSHEASEYSVPQFPMDEEYVPSVGDYTRYDYPTISPPANYIPY